MIKLTDIKVGMRVRVRDWFGGVNVGTVVAVEEDVKNGRPGIDYETDDGEGFWCYLDQVLTVA